MLSASLAAAASPTSTRIYWIALAPTREEIISWEFWVLQAPLSPKATFLWVTLGVAVDIPGPFPWKHIAGDSSAWVPGQELSTLRKHIGLWNFSAIWKQILQFLRVLLWNVQLCQDLSHALSWDGKTSLRGLEKVNLHKPPYTCFTCTALEHSDTLKPGLFETFCYQGVRWLRFQSQPYHL